ncbi:MAG: helix-turn-helix transcriptional regulator [Nitrospiraceae bacterium]|nr:MAG: helix-turn-helix transcriptional regulator [Nitrospiraceae bacterium]
MIPFGDTILLWRRHRSLSQKQLADMAALPRPNLSDIEKGKRDVTLSTIRSLANALGVSPGTLANGEPPQHMNAKEKLSRKSMERIASAVARERPPRDPIEYNLYQLLRKVLRCSLRSAREPREYLPLPARKSDRAWLLLRALYPAETLNSLIVRSLEKAELQWTNAK